MRINGQPVPAHVEYPSGEIEVRDKSRLPGAVQSNTSNPAPEKTPERIEHRSLQLIREAQEPGLEIRGEKIAALKEAIAEGRFNISDAQLAEAMLNEFQK